MIIRRYLAPIAGKSATEFRWLQQKNKGKSASKTEWASCAVKQSTTQVKFPRKRGVRQPSGLYVSGKTVTYFTITLAAFAFLPLTGPTILGYGGSAAAGGTYAIIGEGIGNLGLFGTGAIGTWALLNPNIKTPTFTNFNKPCDEGANTGNFG